MRCGAVAVVWGVLAAALGGCGGQYILTVPDQLAPAGGQTAAVIRLQRNDFFVLSLPVKSAPVRFRVDDGPERAAYTDDLGYAGAMMPAPAATGLYTLDIAHLDKWGDEVTGKGAFYVWDPNAPAVAVDMDCLPGLLLGSARGAAAAIGRLATGGNVLYLTRRAARELGDAHRRLRRAGYPEGPILTWQRENWHIVYEDRFGLRIKMPRVVVETRLVNSLPAVRQTFTGLQAGVCDSALAARAFERAGLKVLRLGELGAAGGQ